jgi:hypothetical protein
MNEEHWVKVKAKGMSFVMHGTMYGKFTQRLGILDFVVYK